MKALHELSVAEIGSALRSGRLSSVALTQSLLTRIAELDPALHAFITLTAERALADAARADQELAAGRDRGPLHGVPYGLKDILDTKGILTTCGSRLYRDHKPAEDAAVEEKLRAGGAVLLGKLATSEFACGGPSADVPYPPARNPWNTAHYTGGSSSGSAAAVASGMMRVAIGSDTGGSIRVPASYCGVVGLKPTYGLVSRRGLYPLSYSLDHCGPLTGSVEDMALVMNVIAGHDSRDPASVDRPRADFRAGVGRDIKGLRVGYARQFHVDTAGILPDVVTRLDEAAQRLSKLGADIGEVALPDFELFRACSRCLITAEAFAVHEQNLKERGQHYGRLTYQRLIAGVALSAADLVQAFRMRRELVVQLDALLRDHDVLMLSTGMGQAPVLDLTATAPPPMVGSPTVIASVTGHPAMSVPMGFAASGLPLGMQIIGRPFGEPTMFQIGAAFEAASSAPSAAPLIRSKAVSASS